MSWKASFEQGLSNFKKDEYLEALKCFDDAISLGCNAFTIYDSRAAVHERLGNNRAALMDAKTAVDIAPDRWQGYARSARLFHAIHKYDAALKMIDLALERIKTDDVHRRQELSALKSQATDASRTTNERRRARIAKTAYHIGKLPVEMLVEIFSVVVAIDHAQVLKLSHICKHWRGMAVGTPSLWNTLVVPENHPDRKIRLWVQRAQTRISILSFRRNVQDWPSILSALIPLSWCSLRSLTVSRSGWFSKICDLLSKTDTISRLKHLDVVDADFTKISSSFEDSHLESLRLSGSTSSMNKLWSRVNRLKTLNVKSAGWMDVSVGLLANPSLENLILDGLIPEVPNSVNTENCVQLPCLKCMQLHNMLACEVTRFVVAPNLQVLHLFGIHGTQDVLLDFVQADLLPPLRELRLELCTTSTSSLKTILAGAPSLETLQISGIHGIINDVLRFLSNSNPNDSQQDVCPALKHVDLSNCGDLLTGGAYSFVKGRLHAYQLVTGDENQSSRRAEIESLKLDGCLKIDAEILPWFREKVKVFSCVYMSKKEAKRRR